MIKKRSFWGLLILSFITCGIYSIFFFWGYVNDINKVCEGEGKPSPNYIVVILLSAITLGIYAFYWYYAQGNRLANKAEKYGLRFNANGTTVLLCMTLGSLVCGLGPLFGTYILIDNLNKLADEYNKQFLSNNNNNNTVNIDA